MRRLLSNIINIDSIYVFMVMVPVIMILTPVPNIPDRGVDSRIQHHVDKFERTGRFYKKDPNYKIPEISIGIGKFNDFNLGIISPNAIGVCYYMRNPRTITIDEDFWNGASGTEREMAVFHELGHCALNRGHRNILNPFAEQISIMHRSIINEERYRRNYGYYMDELFNPY